MLHNNLDDNASSNLASHCICRPRRVRSCGTGLPVRDLPKRNSSACLFHRDRCLIDIACKLFREAPRLTFCRKRKVHFQNPIAILDNLVPRTVHSGNPEERRVTNTHAYDSWVGPHQLLEAHVGHGARQESNFGSELCVWDGKREVIDLHLGIWSWKAGFGCGIECVGD
jgi:hypothetical protein